MRPDRNHIDDWPELIREQALLGELDSETESRLVQSAGFSQFKADRIAENEAILARYPFQEHIAEMRQRAPEVKKSHRVFPSVLWTALPAAAALVAVLLLLQPFRESQLASEIQDTRIKGSARDLVRGAGQSETVLEVWHKVGESAQAIENGAQVKPYENLQIAYRTTGKKFGIIVSLDGNGQLTLHYPESFNSSTALVADKSVVLPYGYQLDNAPDFERFFLITSDREFLVDTVWHMLERQWKSKPVEANWAKTADLTLDIGFKFTSFLLNK